MPDLTGKIILIAIPKNQFDEREVFGLRDSLTEAGAKVVILSKTGAEAVGSEKTRFQPDGRIVDWDKINTQGKYDAVLVTGGKGAPKFLWDDDILPQILTDHFRAEKVLGGIGLGVAVLVRANLLANEAAGPDDEKFLKELEGAGVNHIPEPVVKQDNILTCRNAESIDVFSKELMRAISAS